jgi:hypothetical protein
LLGSRKDKSKRRVKLGTSKEEKGKGREKMNSRESNTEMANIGPSFKKKRKGKMRKGTSFKQEDKGSNIEIRDIIIDKCYKWNPKEIRKGKKILG